jgi:hypothetical protein
VGGWGGENSSSKAFGISFADRPKAKSGKLKNESIKARTKFWRVFTADQVSPKQAARLHRILQRQAYNKLGLLKRDDGSLTKCPEESYKLLMQEHFPGSMPLEAKDPCAADFDPNETSTSPPTLC